MHGINNILFSLMMMKSLMKQALESKWKLLTTIMSLNWPSIERQFRKLILNIFQNFLEAFKTLHAYIV
jgi:hypothetical protein